MRGSRAVGSACVSRAGLKAWPSLRVRCSGVAPKQAFPVSGYVVKVRDREDALASTRDACATLTPWT